MSKKIILVSCAAVLVFSMCLNAFQEDEKNRTVPTGIIERLQPPAEQQSIVSVPPQDVARTIVGMVHKEHEIKFIDPLAGWIKVKITDYTDDKNQIVLHDFIMSSLGCGPTIDYVLKHKPTGEDISKGNYREGRPEYIVKLPENSKLRISIYSLIDNYTRDIIKAEDIVQIEGRDFAYLGTIYLADNKVSTVIEKKLSMSIYDAPLKEIKEIELYPDRAYIRFLDNDKWRVEAIYAKTRN